MTGTLKPGWYEFLAIKRPKLPVCVFLDALPFTEFWHSEYWINRSSFSHRNQRPAQATWSPDGSILAVSHGRLVTVWSVTTNALYGTFTSSDVPEFSRLVFVGKNGRFIGASGSKAFVLWDLVSARRRFPSQFLIAYFSDGVNSRLHLQSDEPHSWAFCASKER